MKIRIIISFTIFTFLCPFYGIGSDFEEDSNSIEQKDMKTIDQIEDESPSAFEATPMEQDDVKTIDQLNN